MKAFRIIEAALLLAAIAISFAFYLRIGGTMPSDGDVAALSDRLAGIQGEAPSAASPSSALGDGAVDAGRSGHAAAVAGTLERAILLSPFWAERPRTWGLPFPILSTARQSRPEDFGDLSEILVLAFPSLPGADVEGTLSMLKAGGFEAVGAEERFGKISLFRLKNAHPRRIAFRASTNLMDARLSAGNEDCQKRPDRHVCTAAIGGGRNRSIHVLPTYRELNSRPFRCIDFMPLGETPMTALFQGVDLGEAFTVVAGPVGQSNARHKPKRRPLEFKVTVDGMEVTRWTFMPGEMAERRLTMAADDLEKALATSGKPVDATRRHDVAFQVTADTGHPVGFCFEAEAWR